MKTLWDLTCMAGLLVITAYVITFAVMEPRLANSQQINEPLRVPVPKMKSIIHTDSAWNFAFSPDGKHLASVNWLSRPSTLKIWDLRTGKEVVGLILNDPARTVAYSPDGKTLAVSQRRGVNHNQDGRIVLYDTSTWKSFFTIDVAKSAAPICFSPHGKLFAVGTPNGAFDNRVMLFDTANWKKVSIVKSSLKTGPANVVAFSRDGKLLAAGSAWIKGKAPGGFVTVWKLPAKKEIFTIAADPRQIQTSITGIDFSSDNRRLAVAHRWFFASIIDIERERTDNIGRFRSRGQILFAPNTQSVVTGYAGITFWDLQTKLPVFETEAGAGTDFIAFSRDRKLLGACDGKGVIRIWRTKDITDWINAPPERRSYKGYKTQQDRILDFIRKSRRLPGGGQHRPETQRLRDKYRKGGRAAPIKLLVPPKATPPDRRPRIAPDAIPRRKDIG